jgi:hypothetical protein
LEVRRPHRGTAVLILLGVAGLLRPEAWLYAAGYWLWLVTSAPRAVADRRSAAAGRPQLLRWTLLAAAAPLIWIASDLAITGNPLHSLTGTHDLAAALQRSTGLTAVPAMLAVFAGAGAFGWTRFPRGHPARRLWMPAGTAALLAIVAFFPLQQVGRLDLLKDDIANRDRIQADLKQLVERPAVRRALRACDGVAVPSHRLVPLIALWADIRPQHMVTARAGGSGGCLVSPANETVAKLAVLDANEPGASLAPYRGPVTARNRSWLFHYGG